MGHPGRIHAFLPADPRQRREIGRHVEKHQHAGEVEKDVENEIDPPLGLFRPKAVKKVGPNMHALGQGVSRTQHEKRAVKHARDVVRPHRRGDEGVPRDDLVDHGENQRNGQPADDIADDQAELVDAGDRPGHPARHVIGHFSRWVAAALCDQFIGDIQLTGIGVVVGHPIDLPRVVVLIWSAAPRQRSPRRPAAREWNWVFTAGKLWG